MEAALIFEYCNTAAPFGWFLLIVAPRWKWTRTIVTSGFFPLVLGLIYLIIAIGTLGKVEGDFGSLEGVAKLFENPFALTAGWIHYLAFDMFIGAWEVSDSQKHNISHFLVIPCLIMSFMLGPVGLLLYFIVRFVRTRKFFHHA